MLAPDLALWPILIVALLAAVLGGMAAVAESRLNGHHRHARKVEMLPHRNNGSRLRRTA
jgi:uncharacterized integral membrane protein